MGRIYLVFGSDNGDQWVKWGEVEASSATQAMSKAFNEGTHGYRHYAAVPARNWASATPEVKTREPVITWKSHSPAQAQMSVDDVLKQEKKDDVVPEPEVGGGTPEPAAPAAAEPAAEKRKEGVL